MKNMSINFQKGNGLIPVIVQDYVDGVVYMLGYMNKEAFEKTNKSGWVYFWSRSKNRLWMKGEESGNKLEVKDILLDCDGDTLLIKAKLTGKNVCHTGDRMCFIQKL